MQFNFVTVTLACLVASAAAYGNGTATNGTNSTTPNKPTPVPGSGAFQNAVSGGLLGAGLAGAIAMIL